MSGRSAEEEAHEKERDGAAPRGRVALAGGGTAGHVFPALAVGEALAHRGWSLTFYGSPSGFEARIVPARGVPFVALAARPFLGRGPIAKLGAALTLVRSAFAARRSLRGEGTAVLVATGGYVAAPVLAGARLARIPFLLVEPNARAGAANRLASRWAAAAAVAFAETAGDFVCPARVTGVPVRPEFFALPALREQGKPRLLVLGGSQGSKLLNERLPPALARVFAERPELSALHQCGERHLEATHAAYAAAGLDTPRLRIAPFVDDVAQAMGAVDLVVARAGAMTGAEIAAAGRPALFVPLAIAGGHQIENARRLESAGAARVLLEEEATSDRLAAELLDLLAERARLVAMGSAARALARPGAAEEIADAAEALARGEAA